MEQLLAHLAGDYVLQNHWMAIKKTTRLFPALVHAVFYTLPFLLLTLDYRALLVIGATHLIIDRFRLAQLWVDFWGNGKEGWLLRAWMTKVLLWNRIGDTIITITEPPGGIVEKPVIADAPPFLGVWLLILVDNTMHLCINYASLRWLG